jgi:hypothetical protein
MLGEEQKPPRYLFAEGIIPPRTLRVLLRTSFQSRNVVRQMGVDSPGPRRLQHGELASCF